MILGVAKRSHIGNRCGKCPLPIHENLQGENAALILLPVSQGCSYVFFQNFSRLHAAESEYGVDASNIQRKGAQ